MKRIIMICLMVFMTVTIFAQKDVTTFLGIPVDGTKSEMVRKIAKKGFTIKKDNNGDEYLTGRFNGRDVYIHIDTNKNKVYSVVVLDIDNVEESAIKIRFNNLVEQFENNSRYVTLKDY